jgi:hypothetical protein
MKLNIDFIAPNDKFSEECMAIFKEGVSKDELNVLMVVKSHEIVDKFKYVRPEEAPESYKKFVALKKKDKNGKCDWDYLTDEQRTAMVKKLKSDYKFADWFEKFSKNNSNNISNAVWLENCIITTLSKGDKQSALDFWHVYEQYPSDLMPVWEKRKDIWFKERDETWKK